MRSRILAGAVFLSAAGVSFSLSQAAAFDDVQTWYGNGQNQAALVIEWNDGKADTPLTLGYRWDGEANGEQMLTDIVAADPNLYLTLYHASFGTVIGGIGYDVDGNGLDVSPAITFISGIYEAQSDTELDSIHAAGPSDHYQGGWFSGYWSYEIKDDAQDDWAYSWVGATDRDLTNGSWDKYSFVAIPEPASFGLFMAGAALSLMNRRRRKAALAGLVATCGIAVAGTANTAQAAYVYDPTDFAVEVISSNGPFGSSPYNDPAAILGEPATNFYDMYISGGGAPDRRVKIVEPAFNTDTNGGNKLITTLNVGSQITVRMGRKVYNDPANPYGIDLIVFGNAFFVGNGFVNDDTNMNTYTLTGGIFAEPMKVSVSPDGENWFRYDDGPYADGLFPTNGYLWDRDTASWTDELSDPTKPVNPALTAADFAGLTGADALDLYEGSAGGTGFDLALSGFDWIEYVRIEGLTGFAYGEIDAIAAVRAVPEPATIGLVVIAGMALLRRRRFC